MFLTPGWECITPGSALAFLKTGLEDKSVSTPLVIVTVIGVAVDTVIGVAFATLMGAGVVLAFLKPGLEDKNVSTPSVLMTVIGVVVDTAIGIAFATLRGESCESAHCVWHGIKLSIIVCCFSAASCCCSAALVVIASMRDITDSIKFCWNSCCASVSSLCLICCSRASSSKHSFQSVPDSLSWSGGGTPLSCCESRCGFAFEGDFAFLPAYNRPLWGP